MEQTIVNRCLECGINMGSSNPRQYCGKLYCRNEDLGFKFYEPNRPEHEYYRYGSYDLHINEIIYDIGLQFETISEAYEWRINNNNTFSFLVSLKDKKFICPLGYCFDFSNNIILKIKNL